ncbi:uncharacterized protein LOC102804438 [Saccoglossus kowalevskii]|uniref:Uncharacterized protein LOC102804438 n=1 Tax=Saccoglossus kowalevskii TaxID=10224 RepID=A0ABM0M3F8_SACKO|nr:PREDICTED: uncharacterized protein LOC102804438 [Saccoglossus kowalevskii]
MLEQLSGALTTEETKPLTERFLSPAATSSSVSHMLLPNYNTKSSDLREDQMSEGRRLSADNTPNKYRKSKMRISKSVDYERLPQDDPSNSPPCEVKNRSQSTYFDVRSESPQKTLFNEKQQKRPSLGRKSPRSPSESGEMYRKLSGLLPSEADPLRQQVTPPIPALPDKKTETRATSLRPRHPTKKLLRTSSESAIQVNRFSRQKTISCSRPQAEGIVCSNDDLQHILKLAKNHKRDTKKEPTKRPVSSIGRLMSLPEFIPNPGGKENVNGRRQLANFERVGRSAEAPAATGNLLSSPSLSPVSSLSSHSSSTSSTIMNKSNPLTHVLTSSSTEHIFPNVIYEGNYESEEEMPEFELKPISEVVDVEHENIETETEACETTLSETSAAKSSVDDAADMATDLSSILSAFNPELLGKAIEARLAVEIQQRDSDDSDEDSAAESKKLPRSKKCQRGGETWVPNQEQQGSKWQSLLSKLNLRKKEDNTGTGVKV